MIYCIIVHWRNLDDTRECLEALDRTIVDEFFRVILINNDKERFPIDVQRKFSWLFIIENGRNVGFAAANNQGIRQALEEGAEAILILNNDTLPQKNFLSPLIEIVRRDPKVIVSPVLWFPGGKRIENAGGDLFLWLGISRLRRTRHRRPPDYLSGACFLAHRTVFNNVGLFDEHYFTYFEDTDWCYRAREKGYRLRVVQESLVWHKHSASTKKARTWAPTKMFYVSRNTFIFAKKRLKGLRRWIWCGGYFMLGGPLLVLGFCRDWRTLGAYIKGLKEGMRFSPGKS